MHNSQNGHINGTTSNNTGRRAKARASASANPLKLAYDPTGLLALPQPIRFGDMCAPFSGISGRAIAPRYPLPTYASGNMATIATDLLAPHKVLQDSIMSALSPTAIAYIVDIVSG